MIDLKKKESLLPVISDESVSQSSSDINPVDNENRENVFPADENVNPIYTSEWLKKNTSIHGWLTFFLFAIFIGGLISAAVSVFTINLEDYANNVFLILGDVLSGVLMFAIAIYTIYAFNHRKPNAVFYGKVYVSLALITNILSLIIGEFDSQGLNTVEHTVWGCIWGVIWLLYLLFSKQVSEIIPSSFRKITSRDWLIVAAIILIPFFCYLIGYIQVQNTVKKRESHYSALLSMPLEKNERTDGRMIFQIPDNFECTDEDITLEEGLQIKVFNIDNEYIGSCTLCSDYDDEVSRSNFNDYRNNWKDESASSFVETERDEGERIINGNRCLYKITSYDIDGTELYWRFMILFDDETGKCAVLSFYDRNESITYVDELLKSIRFK